MTGEGEHRPDPKRESSKKSYRRYEILQTSNDARRRQRRKIRVKDRRVR